MSVFLEALEASLNQLDIQIEATALGRLEQHWRLLAEYNQKFNLTAIRHEGEAALKHYADCLLLLKGLSEPTERGFRAADIGSGAGFPGLVLAICCPKSSWLLLEASAKKCGFLELCLEELKINNARVLPLRAEEAGHQGELRATFELVTARAVSRLSVLAEYAMPLLSMGGQLAALKGPALPDEQAEAAEALRILGAREAGLQQFVLPGGEKRCIAWYEKISPTPDKYPRRAGMPEKRPL